MCSGGNGVGWPTVHVVVLPLPLSLDLVVVLLDEPTLPLPARDCPVDHHRQHDQNAQHNIHRHAIYLY